MLENDIFCGGMSPGRYSFTCAPAPLDAERMHRSSLVLREWCIEQTQPPVEPGLCGTACSTLLGSTGMGGLHAREVYVSS